MNNYLIVGASSGIGLALAKFLSKDGHRIWATYNQSNPIALPNTSWHALNVKSAFDLSFLPDVIDGLVYCPGSIHLLPFHRIKPADFIADYQLQVVGAIEVIQQALPKLKKSTQASVVMFSTVAVQQGYNFHSQVATNKGAIEGLTRALAAEFAPSIRVNAIAPSLTQTPLAAKLLNTDKKIEANALKHPLKRLGTSEDMAQAAAFLLSNQASWITGHVLPVDGGISAINV